MSSERRTDRNRAESLRRIRLRNRRIRIVRSIVLIVIVLVIMLLCFLCIKAVNDNRIKDWYDTESRFGNIIDEQVVTDKLNLMAEDVCVVRLTDTSPTEEFTPEAGLAAYIDNPYVSFSKNALVKMNPASTTKIMTAIVALKYGNMEDIVTVPPEAYIDEPGASLAGIKPGQTIPMEQLMYGLLLPSGNDCANAIAVHIAGSIEAFADMMNAEAASIGAVHTHFVNPNGLTAEDHYSTAYDLFLMINEALKYDKFVEISGTKNYTAEFLDEDGLAISKTWTNSNKYVNGSAELPENVKAIAGKTGTTLAAGSCLVLVTDDNENRRKVTVVLKAANRNALYENMDFLLLNFNN